MQEANPVDKREKSGRKALLVSGFKQFDIYQKIDESYRVQTSSGAALSLAGLALIAILVLFELRSFMTPRYQEHMVVDTTILSDKLTINVNITFHALNCNEAHLDVMDVAGDNQLNVEHDMIKQRLDKHGRRIGKAGIEIIGEGKLPIPNDLPPDYCGSCYGAETLTRKCCNTCEELLRAYQEHQWNIVDIMRNSSQCIHDRARQFATTDLDEGCTITGLMKVNKVSGNFHIAHGESVVRDGRHIHHFNPLTAPSFNISHTIHSLSFGDSYPKMPTNPMDSVTKIIATDGSTGLFQYFIKVIPTIYTDDRKRKLYTSQYTFSDRFRPLKMPKVDGTSQVVEAILPGIFFVFDISPFMIEVTKSYMPWSHFLTKICAIVGGTFAVIGVVDSLVFKVSKVVSTKR